MHIFAREQQQFMHLASLHMMPTESESCPQGCIACSQLSRHTKHDIITSQNNHRNYCTFHGTGLTKWQSTEPIPATQCRTARSMRISTKTTSSLPYRCNALQRNLSTNPWWTLKSHTNPKPQNPSHHARGWYKFMGLDNGGRPAQKQFTHGPTTIQTNLGHHHHIITTW